ncbi:MAG: glycosyltransferase family 39 protein [Deltaproteobacteria bacterium]|nr:glycosyltransferase family 39 protein [Deltaproteobacteria bacterium]
MTEGTWAARQRDRLVGAGLFLAGFASLLLTEREVGFTRDESVYFHAAESYGRWFKLLWKDGAAALSDASIVRAWDFNHEHPGLMKSLFGLSGWLFHDALGWLRPAAAYRLPAFLVAALALPVLYALGRRLSGRTAGLFAAAAWLLVPRQFFDAHLACFDVPVASFWLLTVYAFIRAQEAPGWWLWTGLCLGLTLATKHNGLFIPFVLLPFAAWQAAAALRETQAARPVVAQLAGVWLGTAALLGVLVLGQGSPEGFLRAFQLLSPQSVVLALFVAATAWLLHRLHALSLPAFRALAPLGAMSTVAPAVFYVTWPYLWHHPVDRTAWYLAFHATHNHYAWTYLGELLRAPPFPLEYVLVKTALTVPLPLLLPMALGWLGVAGRTLFGRTTALAASVRAPSWTELLLAANGIASIAIISHPNVPHFGGTKHWYPSMPFLGLLGGVVVARAAATLETWVRPRWPALPARAAPAALLAALLVPPALDSARIYPWGTSSYTELAGGLPGAASLGMQRQFWSNNVTGVLPWINAHAPQRARVWLHEVNGLSFRDYQRNGMLRADLQPAGGPADAQVAAVQYHQEFREHEYLVWDAFGTQLPATGLYLDETPQVVVYVRP